MSGFGRRNGHFGRLFSAVAGLKNVNLAIALRSDNSVLIDVGMYTRTPADPHPPWLIVFRTRPQRVADTLILVDWTPPDPPQRGLRVIFDEKCLIQRKNDPPDPPRGGYPPPKLAGQVNLVLEFPLGFWVSRGGTGAKRKK